jgi:type II secretory pathway pseudopilin PulG
MSADRKDCRAAAFTLVEVVASLAVLAVVFGVLAPFALWSLQERGRNAERQAALEMAANVLETARAVPWHDLTAEWADKQTLSEENLALLLEGRLSVRVVRDQDLPYLKSVSVEIQWRGSSGGPLPQTVKLETLFSARDTKGVP